MTKLFAFSLFLCCTFLLHAQSDETIFSHFKPRVSGIWAGATNSISRFKDETAVISGGFAGLEFNKSYFVGWGGQQMAREISINNATNPLSLDYNGLMLGYAPQAFRSVHAMVTVMAANGSLRYKSENKDNVFILQPSAGVEINLFKWCRVGLQGGYRFVTDVNVQGIRAADVSTPFAEMTLKFGYSWGINSTDKQKKGEAFRYN